MRPEWAERLMSADWFCPYCGSLVPEEAVGLPTALVANMHCPACNLAAVVVQVDPEKVDGWLERNSS